jgi:hypothetical protein
MAEWREQALAGAHKIRGAVCGLSVAMALVLGTTSATDAVAGGVETTNSGPLRYVTSTVDVSATDDGTSLAICPSGSRVTGGGGAIAGPVDDVRLGGIFPFDFFDAGFVRDDTYIAEAYNNSSEAQALLSVAVCLRNGAGGTDLGYEVGDGPMINMGSSVGTGASVQCPSGRLLGGGLEIPGPATTQFEEQLNSTHPVDSDSDGAADDGWSGKLNVSMSTVARTPHAVAVCQPPGDYRVRYRFTPRVVYPSTTPSIRTKCPAGKGWRVTGGGIQGFFSRLRTSMPFDGKDKGKAPEDGWRGSVRTSSGADPAAMLVHAICIKKA